MKKIIILGIIIVLIFPLWCLYDSFISPINKLGMKCQTGYELNMYHDWDIPDNSCYVDKCCMTAIIFRSRLSYDELEKELKKLENELNQDGNNKYTVRISENKLFYREYYISY